MRPTGSGIARSRAASVARATVSCDGRVDPARRIDKAAPPGRILDVGAGDGTLVAALRATGRDAIGLERSASGRTSGAGR